MDRFVMSGSMLLECEFEWKGRKGKEGREMIGCVRLSWEGKGDRKGNECTSTAMPLATLEGIFIIRYLATRKTDRLDCQHKKYT